MTSFIEVTLTCVFLSVVQQGHLKWGQEEDFEVEAILDYVNEVSQGTEMIFREAQNP